MATQCLQCGKELYAGQRFCRYCGAPRDESIEESTPTQRMPPTAGPGAAHTSRQLQPDTSPVYAEHQPMYIAPPPLPPAARYQVPPVERKRGPWGMIVAFVSAGLLVAVIMAIFFIARTVRNHGRFEGPDTPAAATPLLGTELTDGVAQTIPLDANSRFSIKSTSGSISIEAWDQPQAQIKLIKTGGSSRDRQAAKAAYSMEGGVLSIREGDTRRRVELRYEIKLPRSLKDVRIEGTSSEVSLFGMNGSVSVETASGDIKLSGSKGDVEASSQSGSIRISEVAGRITVTSRSGDIELLNIRGSATVSTVSGETRAVFERIARDEPLRFDSTSGDIDLEFNEMFDADLDAETTSGDIVLDEDFGITVRQNIPGQRAVGPIGKGGRLLSIRTTSGDIRITGRLLAPEAPDKPPPPPPDAPPPPGVKPPAVPESKGKPKGNR